MTPMNAIYSKEECPNRMCADPSTLLNCLSNFPTGLAEVTLVAMPNEVVLKNDVDGVGLDDAKDVGIRTEMRLSAGGAHALPAPASVAAIKCERCAWQPTCTTMRWAHRAPAASPSRSR